MARGGLSWALTAFRDKTTVNVVVETPAGSRFKLKYEPEAGLFALGKILPEGFAFPFDFGFVPGTRADDGDPIDVMLIAEAGTATGCLVPARLLGVLQAEQKKKGEPALRNDRILAVPVASRDYAELTTLKQIPRPLQEQIEYFLSSYGALDGKTLRITRLHGPRTAARLVRQAMVKSRA